MARHRLSMAEQVRGVRAALKSKRTPKQLRPSLRKRLAQLERKVKHGG